MSNMAGKANKSLDMLAAVASHSRNVESTSLKRKRQVSDGLKKSNRKVVLSEMTYEEIKSLSSIQLVNMFSELIVEEWKKIYTFKCIFQPENCEQAFHSCGDKELALRNMISHLNYHLNDMKPNASRCYITTPCDPDPEFSNFNPKSSKIDISTIQSVIAKELIAFKNQGNITNAKDIRKTVANKSVFQCTRKTRSSTRSLHCLNPVENVNVNSVHSLRHKNEESSSILFVNKDVSKVNEVEKNLDVFKDAISIDHDHCYSKLHLKNSHKTAKVPAKKITFEKFWISRVLPQFIIPSPPFPHILGSKNNRIASVCEIDENCKPVHYVREMTMDNAVYIKRVISSVAAKTQSNTSCRKRLSRPSNKIDFTGSVLECVENRVSMKSSLPSTSKGIYSTFDNYVEDVENLQKSNAEKEMALEFIQELTSLKKKKLCSEFLVCRICEDKNFTAITTLVNHYRSHAGIKPYACMLCKKTFTRKHSLKYHILIHENKTRFFCKFCEHEFRHPNHFKEHLRRHTGETPFTCPECNSSFKTRNTFKRHLMTKHKKQLTKKGIKDITDVAPKV
ncbi:putative ovo [Nephila pilipes]|uniref:Putative ovo n=1 Tax=Nephila pilipes TaxID=299642 RepID=A0A8X6JUU8_NEPPI|nr:putative ovo [Nephila pilipes]